MTMKPENPSAFPRTGYYPPEGLRSDALRRLGCYAPPQDGMTLRDYFAAHAMAAMATLCSSYEGSCEITPAAAETVARWAYLLAEAMLAERQHGHQS